MTEDSITVTVAGKDTVEWIRGKVRRGHFPSETDLIAHSIEALREEDAELESWLKDVVTKRYDAHKANPSSALTLEQVQETLTTRRQERTEQSL